MGKEDGMRPKIAFGADGRRSLSPWAFAALFSLAFILSGCGLLPPRGQEGSEAPAAGRGADDGQPRPAAAPPGRFEEPGDLDRLVDARPLPMAAVKPVSTVASATLSKAAPEVAAGKGRFRIQVGAESDIDVAQAKKREYERSLGGTVDVVFDAPYYKLRWGFFETKQDADDKILEIREFKIQGFVIKQ